ERAFDDRAVTAPRAERTVTGRCARFFAQGINPEIEHHRTAGIAKLESGLVAATQLVESVSLLPADGIDTVAVVVRSRELVELDFQIAVGGVDAVGEQTCRAGRGITEVDR